MKMTDIWHLICIGSEFNSALPRLRMRLFTALTHCILGRIKITTVNLTFLFYYTCNSPVYIFILVMKNCPPKFTLHQGLSLRVDRKHWVQYFAASHELNVDDWSPSTTTLDELLLGFCPEEEVALFRAKFDGEEAGNIQNTQMNVTKHNIKWVMKTVTS